MEGFPSGIAFSPNGDILWVGLLGGETLKPIAGLLEIDVENWSVSREMDMDALIWDLAYLPDSGTLFATDIEGSSLHIIDVDLWEQVGTVEIPTSPTGIAVDPIQGRIWVAASGADAIATIDPTSELVTQWTPVTDLAWVDEDGEPLPNSNVNSLHYDPMRDWLFATRGADNAVSIFDASTMELIGQLPTAWYPTASTYISETNTLLIAEGKGFGKGPDDEALTAEELEERLRDGSLSIVALDEVDLAEASLIAQEAFERPIEQLPECDGFFPIPLNPEVPSPIEHVILVVKENKTFDCVFGDLEGMDVDVDPSLVRWGEEITPNQHALAREFCLADNFYAEVPNSDVGHVFLTAGHLTEFVEHFWKEDAQYGTNPTFSPLQPDPPRLRQLVHPSTGPRRLHSNLWGNRGNGCKNAVGGRCAELHRLGVSRGVHCQLRGHRYGEGGVRGCPDSRRETCGLYLYTAAQ